MEPTGPILKKTFVTVALMLGSWVAFMGTVSTAAVLITSHAVGAPETSDKSSSAAPAADKSAPNATPGAPGSGPGAKHVQPQRI